MVECLLIFSRNFILLPRLEKNVLSITFFFSCVVCCVQKWPLSIDPHNGMMECCTTTENVIIFFFKSSKIHRERDNMFQILSDCIIQRSACGFIFWGFFCSPAVSSVFIICAPVEIEVGAEIGKQFPTYWCCILCVLTVIRYCCRGWADRSRNSFLILAVLCADRQTSERKFECSSNLVDHRYDRPIQVVGALLSISLFEHWQKAILKVKVFLPSPFLCHSHD